MLVHVMVAVDDPLILSSTLVMDKVVLSVMVEPGAGAYVMAGFSEVDYPCEVGVRSIVSDLVFDSATDGVVVTLAWSSAWCDVGDGRVDGWAGLSVRVALHFTESYASCIDQVAQSQSRVWSLECLVWLDFIGADDGQ